MHQTFDINTISMHGHYIALFDILGFEQRLAYFGLNEMLARYEALIEVVKYREKQIKRVFGDFNFKESPYWLADGDIFMFTKTHGAYASDSILIWANRTWPDIRDMSLDELSDSLPSPADEWKYHPIPCDNFLDVCNDLMCCALEVGLPLRGAIAVGDAILDLDQHIFLGQPVIDAARLENQQDMISTSFCRSAVNQIIPQRFTLQFDRYMKRDSKELWGGVVLDWPRHWRNTRKNDLKDTLQALDNNPDFSHVYNRNTLELVDYSEQFADKFESIDETSLRSVYGQFHWSNASLALPARAVRRVPITTISTSTSFFCSSNKYF
ncbi:hypothetical protein [Methylobacillus sp. Pita1]|uniref:hypothetical protein n=1 Tax=Methylobacillus sp. Pita1 TaxID=3382642 RepID=UPI0038B55A51